MTVPSPTANRMTNRTAIPTTTNSTTQAAASHPTVISPAAITPAALQETTARAAASHSAAAAARDLSSSGRRPPDSVSDSAPGSSPGTVPRGDESAVGDDPAEAQYPPPPPFPAQPGGSKPTLADLIVPLATVLGRDERPGEGHGLGTLDPALARTLAATAAHSPHTTICITVTNPDGIAIGHGCAKPGRRAPPPDGPAPPRNPRSPPASTSPSPPPTWPNYARSPTPDHPAHPDHPRHPRPPKAPGPPRTSGSPRTSRSPRTPGSPGRRGTGWALAPPHTPGAESTRAMPATGSPTLARGTTVARRPRPAPGDPDWCGPWTLTLPSGLQYVADLQPVPTFDCDHRNESHAYKPNATLRHLVQVRDHICTFPTCNRHARETDFEHAVPYDQGGRTCACNAGARSRKCHRVKQSPGWNLTQPKPGWHQWDHPPSAAPTPKDRRNIRCDSPRS